MAEIIAFNMTNELILAPLTDVPCMSAAGNVHSISVTFLFARPFQPWGMLTVYDIVYAW
jgi:hypothetical protein